MNRKQVRLLITVACGFAAGAGGVTALRMSRNAQSAPPPSSEQPVLTVDPARLDFGEVWETDKFEWVLPVRNNGPVSAAVSASESSCGCVAPLAAAQLPAGDETPLKVHINLRQQCVNADPQAVRDSKIRLMLTHATPAGTHSCTR